jgi:hypothetical protein
MDEWMDVVEGMSAEEVDSERESGRNDFAFLSAS